MENFGQRLTLSNGLEVSIQYSDFHYCSARYGVPIDDPGATFEVAVFLPGDVFYPIEIHDDVVGWVSREELANLIFRTASASVEDVQSIDAGFDFDVDPLGLRVRDVRDESDIPHDEEIPF
jgi:hypothetical protein